MDEIVEQGTGLNDVKVDKSIELLSSSKGRAHGAYHETKVYMVHSVFCVSRSKEASR